MKFIAETDRLLIELEGVEVFFGLKRKIDIPRTSIVNLNWYPEFRFDQTIWRTMGSSIPGVLYAGHFRGGGQHYYLYLHQPSGVAIRGPVESSNTLVINTRDFPIHQIVLTCQPDIGANLIAWWKTT